MSVIIKKRNISTSGKQRGVVLLLTLIILVAMMLAGIGMMRSIDTGTVVAGNLAFKQSTTHAADGGTSTGFNALAAVAANTGNPTNDKANKLILSYNFGQPCPANANNPVINVSDGNGNLIPICTALGNTTNLQGYQPTPLNICEVTPNTPACLLVMAAAPTTTAGVAIAGCPAGATQSQWYQCSGSWNGSAATPIGNLPGGPITIAATGTTVSYLIHRMCTTPNASPSYVDPAVNTCQYYLPSPGIGLTFSIPSYYYRITTRSVGPRNTITYTQTLVLIS